MRRCKCSHFNASFPYGSHADILKAYGSRIHEHEQGDAVIILKRRRLKVMAQGKRMFEKVVGRG